MNTNSRHDATAARLFSILAKLASERNNMLKFAVIFVDLALAVISYFIAFLMRFSGDLPEFNTSPFIASLPLLALSFLAYADVNGLLKFFRKTRRQVFSSILKLVFMQTLTTTTITYFLQGFSFPRSVLISAALIQAVLLTGWNWLMLAIRDRITQTSRAMVIGSDENVKKAKDNLQNLINTEKIEIYYTFLPEEKETYLKIIKKSRVDEVILCAGLSEDLKMEIMLLCMNLRKVVSLVPEVFEIALLNTTTIRLENTPLLVLDRLSLSFEQRMFKRVFDITATVISLPLLFPFMLAVAIGIKLTSPGSVFYSQERITGGGRVYKLYKFRTMQEDAERMTGPIISSENDARVTKFGRFLRRYRIDEFPQLINVIKGDMSLVGPRSERPFFAERFSRDIDGYNVRNNVKAGLTGYAQVFGNYDTDAELKLKYDILYIRDYSLLLDIKLIFQTFNAILRKGGS